MTVAANVAPKNARIMAVLVKRQSVKQKKGYTRLFLNVGKTDGFYANQIIELINRNMKKQRTTMDE